MRCVWTRKVKFTRTDSDADRKIGGKFYGRLLTLFLQYLSQSPRPLESPPEPGSSPKVYHLYQTLTIEISTEVELLKSAKATTSNIHHYALHERMKVASIINALLVG